MDLSSVLALLLGYVPTQYAAYVLALCGLCAVASALWPRPADGSSWLPLYQIVNALGCNFLAARNHSAAAPVQAAAPASAGVPVALVGDKPAPVPPKP